MQRVQGVARVDVFGGADPELQVIVDPQNLARYRLTVPEVVDVLREAGISLTAGDVDEGKRRYVVRSEGEFHSAEDVAAVVLRSIADPDSGRLGRVTVADIAEVRFGTKEPTATIRVLGEPALVARAIRELGSNVIETMDGIRAAVDELNAQALPAEGLQLRQVYDETIYINSAISLVTQNIYIGGTLAALMLLLFLRSFGATLIVSVAIPVSVIASFVAMAAMGRSINVVSLAGIAFAVGMVVDAAIVVLENIYRLRQEGKSAPEAAYEGAAQVWGAILVSALTTVMVFIPILTMQLEVGQLFRDIAVAISVAVILSLIVAVTLIPAMATRLLGGRDGGSLTMMRIPVVDDIAAAFSRAVLASTRRIVASRLVLARRGRRGDADRGHAGLDLPAEARIPARGQPEPRLRHRHPAARLQSRHDDRDRDRHRGRGPPSLGIGDRARADRGRACRSSTSSSSWRFAATCSSAAVRWRWIAPAS